MTSTLPRDPADSIPAFLATCCEVNFRFSESVRSLGQAWGRWLLLQRFPTAVRRQYGERWLVRSLTSEYGFVRVRSSGNRMKVKGLALREGRFAPPLPDSARTTISLLASSVSLPESVQAHIPLAGATANKRPPSAEIVRRFLAACCEVVPTPAQQPGESRLALRRRTTVESLTRLALVLREWLTQGGASPSLVRLCSSQWLRRELEHQGKACFIGTLDTDGVPGVGDSEFAAGITLVADIALLPEWSGAKRQHRMRHDRAGKTIVPVPEGSVVQRRRLSAYNDRLDRQAKARLHDSSV